MYLSKIYIKNFRGIKELLVEFDKKLNVIIGANGQLKTSLMDAIRLFYVWGEPNRDIEITKEDFYVEFTQNPDGTKVATTSTRIDICYLFEGLSAQQEGAFYQYLDRKDDGSMVARVHLSFEMKEKGRIYSSYEAGVEVIRVILWRRTEEKGRKAENELAGACRIKRACADFP